MQISSNTYFTYDGHQSYLYGLRFAWIENSPETDMVSEKKYSQIKNNSQNYFRVAKTTHEDALEFDAEMASDRVLLDAEVRRIYSKFFDKNQYKTLCLPVNGEDIYFNCIMTNVEKVEGGHRDKYGVVGFKLKILCDAPWGWTNEKIITPKADDSQFTEDANGDYALVDGKYTTDVPASYSGSMYKYDMTAPGKFTIRNRTDSQDYIYPFMEITVPQGGDVEEGTRIPNQYSCLACPLITRCRGTAEGFPAYMTDAEAAQYALFAGTTSSANTASSQLPKKAMIINKSDDKLRGTCVFCKTSAEQTIKMEPRTGTITGHDGDSGTNTTKVNMTNKVFVRLVPGDNEFYVENVPVDENGKYKLTLKYKEARILV